ncbi:hypothetical protein Bca52824_004052 [Brassica carinata]|uniref:Inosine/uridine-preferring nucleoside hydrolase domain-containing protein n=1 Tax=Brassica carinata TaxID=52824 RepID=A0A8X8BF73_BRACI|nr:hypothetical protein Bca52824_004052 [Brassica carinata]
MVITLLCILYLWLADVIPTMRTKMLRLSTVSGKVLTQDATRNALLRWDIAGYPDVGSSEPVKVSDYLGEVTILALGPLINLAIPIKRDSSLASTVKMIVFSGAFFALGNNNPPAEANIYADPEAADVRFMSEADITVGINISTQLKLTDDDLLALRDSKGNTRDCKVTCAKFTELGTSNLMECTSMTRVGSQGICVGHRLIDQALKRTLWVIFSPISMAWTVNVEKKVLECIKVMLGKLNSIFNSRSVFELYKCKT